MITVAHDSGARVGGHNELERIMRTSIEEVMRYAETRNVDNRIAAYVLAIDRVADTLRAARYLCLTFAAYCK